MSAENTPNSSASNMMIKDHKSELDCTSKSILKTKQMSFEALEYVQKTRTTKAATPKPATNPLQFVQIKPCNLYQSAQEQLKRAEEVKKVKEVVKEDPEDWQSNLDNWKSCRRKRVEHIIDRVVEAKKLEKEELDRNRKKSKTFSEMMEERGTKGRKISMHVYPDADVADDEDNDDGYENDDDDDIADDSNESNANSTINMSSQYENSNNNNHLDVDSSRYISRNNGHKNEIISSPVYDDNTSNSTLSAASPDSAYTPYNSNDSRHSLASTQSWLDKNDSPASNKVTVRPRMSKINSHVSNFESKFVDAEHDEPNSNAPKVIMSKIDISSRRELFEREQKQPSDIKRPIVLSGQQENAVSIKERLTHLERYGEECRDSNGKSKSNRSSGNFDEARYSYASSGSESQFVNIEPKTPKIDVQIVPLKERLMTLELSMGNETPSYNNKIEQRPAKRAEPKLNMAVTEPRKSIRSIDEQQQSMHKSKHADDRSSLASHPPQSKNRTPPTKLTESSNQVARKPEVLPRRQITPDLVKVTALAETEDDLLQLPEEIDDEADNSVIDALDIALNAIDTEKPNEMIEIATSIDEIYEEINGFKPLKNKAANRKATNPTDQRIQSTTSPSSDMGDEPYYQVPRKQNESYYEVPTSKPMPVYENVDMYYDSTASRQKFTLAEQQARMSSVPIEIGATSVRLPPREKPPPPPIETIIDNDRDDEQHLCPETMKRINSTKRIKREIRDKRTSFLGINDQYAEENYVESATPSHTADSAEQEQQGDKQVYIKSGLYDSSDTTESRDSGVSENHSRQSSEPITTSSEEQEQDASVTAQEILEKDKKLLEAGKNALAADAHRWIYTDDFSQSDDPILRALDEKERARNMQEQICEEEEVLRVERELLELEQEDLKRRGNLNRKLYEQQSQQEQIELRRSLQDVSGNLYANVCGSSTSSSSNSNNGSSNMSYPMQNDHRNSLPNLQGSGFREDGSTDKCIPPVPPAKPLRVQEYLKYGKQIYGGSDYDHPIGNRSMPMNLNTVHSQSSEFLPYHSSNTSLNSTQQQYTNMKRHTLHALSAVPKPKFQDAWVHKQHQHHQHDNNYENSNDTEWSSNHGYPDANNELCLRSPVNKEPLVDSWLQLQHKRRSDPQHFNYNNHWLIQEAEQRRIDQSRSYRTNGNTQNDWHAKITTSPSKIIPRKGSSDNKPLPEAVIQTLTQRVQNKFADKKRIEAHQNQHRYSQSQALSNGNGNGNGSSNSSEYVSSQYQQNGTNDNFQHIPSPVTNPRLSTEAPKEILSVSGKKKCSYCSEELGRGAAMIIESLRLFYHLDCFKCCVCRIQLGDGVSGADVRVRNQKLHCNNCFSSDDGVKFSCV